MRHNELYVADLVDSTRAVREYLDGISREHWDEDPGEALTSPEGKHHGPFGERFQLSRTGGGTSA